MRIGIFGGSFNPPHKMHYNICKKLLDEWILDKIIVVPTGDGYPKAELIDFKYRYDMLRLLMADEESIEVSDFEGQSDGMVYTIQTLRHYKELYPKDEIIFICGLDNLKQIKSWKDYQTILQEFRIIVINRDYTDGVWLNDYMRSLNGKILLSQMPRDGISSSEIRKLLKLDKKMVAKSGLIDENVLNYIVKYQLY